MWAIQFRETLLGLAKVVGGFEVPVDEEKNNFSFLSDPHDDGKEPSYYVEDFFASGVLLQDTNSNTYELPFKHACDSIMHCCIQYCGSK